MYFYRWTNITSDTLDSPSTRLIARTRQTYQVELAYASSSWYHILINRYYNWNLDIVINYNNLRLSPSTYVILLYVSHLVSFKRTSFFSHAPWSNNTSRRTANTNDDTCTPEVSVSSFVKTAEGRGGNLNFSIVRVSDRTVLLPPFVRASHRAGTWPPLARGIPLGWCTRNLNTKEILQYWICFRRRRN